MATCSGFLLIIVFYFIGNGVIPHILLSMLQSHQYFPEHHIWKTNNVLIVLGAGSTRRPNSTTVMPTFMAYSRVYKGATEYRLCTLTKAKCKVIVSGTDVNHAGMSEAGIYNNELTALGVKKKNIVLEEKSRNTFENARYTSNLLKQMPTDEIVLITSGFHIKRALLYFSYFGIKPIPIASDYLAAKISWLPNSSNFVLMDLALHEYMGITKFYFDKKLGLI